METQLFTQDEILKQNRIKNLKEEILKQTESLESIRNKPYEEISEEDKISIENLADAIAGSQNRLYELTGDMLDTI